MKQRETTQLQADILDSYHVRHKLRNVNIANHSLQLTFCHCVITEGLACSKVFCQYNVCPCSVASYIVAFSGETVKPGIRKSGITE